jgi:hypothetical protein
VLDVIDRVAGAAKNLIPPTEGASDRHVRVWRVWIAMATFVNALGLSIHIALACGFAAPFYPGFAQASDTDTIREEMADVKEELRLKRLKELTNLILDTKQKHCLAQGEARRLYYNSLVNMRDEYYEATKHPAPDPPCADFQ